MLAVIPKNVKIDAVTESPDAVIIRAPDAVTGKELRKRLMASANQMAAVAGLLEVSCTCDEASVCTLCMQRGLFLGSSYLMQVSSPALLITVKALAHGFILWCAAWRCRG